VVVVVLLLLGLEFVCLGPLALVRFRAAGSVLMDVQLQRLLVVLGVALTLGGPPRSDGRGARSLSATHQKRRRQHGVQNPRARDRVKQPGDAALPSRSVIGRIEPTGWPLVVPAARYRPKNALGNLRSSLVR